MNGAEPAATTEGTAVRSAPSGARRALRWLAVAVGGTVGIAAVGLYVAHRRADATFDEHRAIAQRERETLAATARGRPALLEPAIPGDARRVIEAFVAAVHAVPHKDRERLPPWVHGGAGVAPDVEQDAILARHPAPLAAIEGLLLVPRAPDPVPATVETAALRIPSVQEGARWLAALEARAVARGDPRAALRLAVVHLVYGLDSVGGGSLVEELVGRNVASGGAAALSKALALGPVDPAEARRLGAALDRLGDGRPWEAVADTERTLVRDALVRAGEPSSARALLDGSEPTTGWRWLWSDRLCAADALRRFDAAWDAFASAPPTTSWSHASPTERNPFLRSAAGAPGFVRGRLAAMSTRLVVTRVAVAVAGFASEQGRLPASLEELVPAWLPRVPLDPLDGRPLRYAEGRVWSVGDDGNDDGGDASDPDAPKDLVAPAPAVAPGPAPVQPPK